MLNVSKAMVASAVRGYFQQGGHDYYIDGYNPPGIWGGELAKEWGLQGQVKKEHFDRLADGYHPITGEDLTQQRRDESARRAANDITISAPKPCTLLYVRTADERIPQAFVDACDEVMAMMEPDAGVRVRMNGADYDRKTGNWAYAGFLQFESRPDENTGIAYPQMHRHHTVFNFSRDPVEQRIKALQIGMVKDNADLWMPVFHNILAHKMRQLGYGVQRDPKAGIVGFGIAGIPRSLIDKFSPRRATILEAKKRIAEAEGITDPERLRRLQAELARLTRKHKQKDLSREELWSLWDRQLSAEDKATLDKAKKQAGKGWKTTNAEALRYALDHLLYRNSVVPEKKLLIEALRYGVGSVTLDGLKAEYESQGMLHGSISVKGEELPGYVTTQAVLAQEDRIKAFAQQGLGTVRPLGADHTIDPKKLAGLSADQQAMVRHIRQSPDQTMLAYGGAGTGKTHALKLAFEGTAKPLAMLAPSADASRDVLRRDFPEANTVAQFLTDKKWQQRIKDGVIAVDEAGLLPIRELEQLCDVARELNARLLLIGDPLQHKAVARHGNMLKVLHDYGGLPVVELKEIQRQKGDYAKGVAAIRDEQWEKGDAIFRRLGWIVEGEGHGKLIEEYAKAVNELKLVKVDGQWQMVPKTILVVDPTHKDGDRLSEALRRLRKADGLIDQEEKILPRLVPLGWSPAEKGDQEQYAGDEVVQFFRRSGPFKAGDRIAASALLPQLQRVNPEYFQVYRQESLPLARGDTIRITAGGATKDGHRVDNGRIDTIAGFTDNGDPILANGWVLGKDFGHIKHGLVTTSVAAQSKTHDIVLASMNRASLGAMGAEQAYVTASRGRERGMIFTDMPRQELLGAMRKKDIRVSASELMRRKLAKKPAKLRDKARTFVDRMRERYRILREWTVSAITEPARQRERRVERGLARERI